MPRPFPAPALDVSVWLNTPAPLALSDLRGKVVMIEAFQMLCPGCVQHGLPQAGRVRATFPSDDLVVIGLHSVFEHHAAQGTEAALSAFLHEYRIGFPVAIDRPDPSRIIPRTMAAYGMQGTPTTILIDREGRLRAHHFGQVTDLKLGAQIQALIGEAAPTPLAPPAFNPEADGCTPEGCAIPSAESERALS